MGSVAQYALMGAGAVGAGVGIGLAAKAAFHPIDTAMGAAGAGINVVGALQSPAALAAGAAVVGGGAAVAAGVGYGAYRMGKGILQESMSGVYKTGLSSRAVMAGARTWQSGTKRLGTMNMHLGAIGTMGLFGGLVGMFEGGLNRHVSESAMATSQTGSAYSGAGGFGTRNQGSMRQLANSTTGLVQGLHSSR